jgi:Zn-dependent protease with chaperone function
MIVSRGEYRFVGEASVFLIVFSFCVTCFVFLFPFYTILFRHKKEISFYPEMNLKNETSKMKVVLEEIMSDLKIDPDSIQVHCVHSEINATALPWFRLIRLGKDFFKQSRVVQRFVFLHEYAHIEQEDHVFQVSFYVVPSMLTLVMNLSSDFVLIISLCSGLVGYLLYCSLRVQKEYAADSYAAEFLARNKLATKLWIEELKADRTTLAVLVIWSICCCAAIIFFSYALWVNEIVISAPFIVCAFLMNSKMSHPFFKRRLRAIERSIQEGLANRA